MTVAELTNSAFGIIFAFTLVGALMLSVWSGSTDPEKVQFQNYTTAKNLSELNTGNLTYEDTQNPESNFLLIVENMNQKLAESNEKANSGNPVDVILGAFGVISAITIGMAQIFLGIFIQGWNFIFGLQANLNYIPGIWKVIGTSAFTLALVLFSVFVVFKVLEFVTGRKT